MRPRSDGRLKASSVFSGATAAAPRWPITSGGPSPRRRFTSASGPTIPVATPEPFTIRPCPRLHAQQLTLDDDTPSLDPLAIERAYRRERARRRARVERRSAARRSDVRFWVTLLVLAFFAAFVILAAWHEVGTLFGV